MTGCIFCQIISRETPADILAENDAVKVFVEGYFSVFKRGARGTCQHCKEKHLHRYLAESPFATTSAWRWA